MNNQIFLRNFIFFAIFILFCTIMYIFVSEAQEDFKQHTKNESETLTCLKQGFDYKIGSDNNVYCITNPVNSYVF